MKWFKCAIQRIIEWAYKDRWDNPVFCGLDVGYRTAGYAILMTRVAGRDFVKVIEISPMTIVEYKDYVSYIQNRYGISRFYCDLPQGYIETLGGGR